MLIVPLPNPVLPGEFLDSSIPRDPVPRRITGRRESRKIVMVLVALSNDGVVAVAVRPLYGYATVIVRFRIASVGLRRSYAAFTVLLVAVRLFHGCALDTERLWYNACRPSKTIFPTAFFFVEIFLPWNVRRKPLLERHRSKTPHEQLISSRNVSSLYFSVGLHKQATLPVASPSMPFVRLGECLTALRASCSRCPLGR